MPKLWVVAQPIAIAILVAVLDLIYVLHYPILERAKAVELVGGAGASGSWAAAVWRWVRLGTGLDLG
jgi:hypothetical protein